MYKQPYIIIIFINDIRSSEVRCANDVKNIYFRLKLKINQIQQLNRKANVYICFILPTKLRWLNQRGVEFNRLIKEDLLPFNLGVTCVDGFAQFLDQRLLLSERLARNVDRYGDPDTLHLNGRGTGLLVTLIKTSINSRTHGGLHRPNRRRFSGDPQNSRVSTSRLGGVDSRDMREGTWQPAVTDGYQG